MCLKISYSILSVTTAVKIDNTTGKITTARENPFDFETQQQIIFQVAATDSEGKRAIAQVTLTVEDINDTPPTISLVGRTEKSFLPILILN